MAWSATPSRLQRRSGRRRSPPPALVGPSQPWEESRSGEVGTSALAVEPAVHDDDCEIPAPFALERGWRTWFLSPETFTELHNAEYGYLEQIQRMRGLQSFSLGVHYSLLPKVITPLLALIVWLSSLPRGASLITFVCANDCLNTAIKWAVQRPRPRWYDPTRAKGLINSCGAWEVDLSFPSAHTMFFSGLAACACSLYALPFWIALALGASTGLSRNFLSMHWPTDTLAGLVLGSVLGTTWGLFDPYGRVLAARSPLLSLGAASGFTVGLLCLMVATRQLVPPVAGTERAVWLSNALQSLSPEERAETPASRRKQIQPRNLKKKIPMLATVWTTIAITGLYPLLLPHAASLPPVGASATSRVLQALIGVGGLAGVASLKKTVGEGKLGRFADGKRGALKALTYVAICTWTFLLSQLAGGWLLKGF